VQQGETLSWAGFETRVKGSDIELDKVRMRDDNGGKRQDK
jgi:hypothetical protein